MKLKREWIYTVVAVIFAFFALRYVVFDQVRGLGFKYGWDIAATCAGPRAAADGLDPYYVKNLTGTSMSWTYPPSALLPLGVLCAAGIESYYVFVWAGLILLMFVGSPDLKKSSLTEKMIAFAYALGGLGATDWVLRTGNITAIEVLLLTLALRRLTFARGSAARPKLGRGELAAAGLFGLALALKVVLAPLVVGLALLPERWMDKMKLMGVAAASYVAVFASSFVFLPTYSASYWLSITGRIPGQHSPSTETWNPSIYFLERAFLERTGWISVDTGYQAVTAVYAATLIAIVISFLLVVKAVTQFKIRRGGFKSFNETLVANPARAWQLAYFALYTMTLSAPRLKEYTYLDLIAFTLPLLFNQKPRTMLISVGISLVPLLNNHPRAHMNTRFYGWDQLVVALVLWVWFGWQMVQAAKIRAADLTRARA